MSDEAVETDDYIEMQDRRISSLEQQCHKLRKEAAELTRLRAQLTVLVEALTGLMEICENAMPGTYFQSDSRVVAARKALATLDVPAPKEQL